MTKPKAIVVGAWLASLAWFLVATWAFLGFTPVSFIAWAVPSWMLFRRTIRWWSQAGNPIGVKAYQRFARLGIGFGALVLGALVWSTAQPVMSSGPTAFDSVLKGIAILCFVVPPVVVTWVVLRSLRVPAEPS